MLYTKYQGSRSYGFIQEYMLSFPYTCISLCKTCDTWMGPFKVMLHTEYQGSRPNGFRQEGVFMNFPI